MSQKRGKFIRELAISGTSAAISKTVVAPLERVKLLLQVQYSHKDIPADQRYKGILDTFSRVWKEQGFLSFWRGNLPNVIRYFPTQALNFAFNDHYKGLVLKDVDRNQDFWKYTASSLAVGGLAGSTTTCIVYPCDFIFTRLSADIGGNSSNRTYTGMKDCFKKVHSTEGIAGFYSGLPISVQTSFLYRALYFGLNDTIRHFAAEDEKNLNFISSFLIAEIVSAIASYAIYPMDTVRRRMLMKGRQTQGSFLHVFKEIRGKEGVKGLYRGALANLFRSTGGALVMVIYKEIQKVAPPITSL